MILNISAILIGGIAGFGVTAGAHRLWCHRAYKAKLPLRIILMLCYSIAGQVKLTFKYILIKFIYVQYMVLTF